METVNIMGDDGIGFKCSRYLHRYLSIDENLKKSLSKNYLWFSDPMGFNDPYDCNMETLCDCTYGEVLDYFREMNKLNNYQLDDQFIIQRAKMLASNREEMDRLSKEGDMKTVSQLGVCCLSERDDSLLMWSHYADKYRGVCLTFDSLVDRDLFGELLFKVEYPETYPVHRFPADYGKFQDLRFLIATKSKDWEYENEVRIVREEKNPPYRGQVQFNKKSLVRITFGHKCPTEKRNEINKLLRHVGGYEHVKFFIAKIRNLSFGVDIQEVVR